MAQKTLTSAGIGLPFTWGGFKGTLTSPDPYLPNLKAGECYLCRVLSDDDGRELRVSGDFSYCMIIKDGYPPVIDTRTTIYADRYVFIMCF